MSEIRFEVEERVSAPIGQVFDRLMDLDGYPDWMPPGGSYRSTVKLSHGPVVIGTVYADKTVLGAAEGEVVESRRPTRVEFAQRVVWWGRRVMEGRIAYELRPVPGGTLVHQTAEARLYAPLRLLAPLIRRFGAFERRRVLTALKQSLESRTACPRPGADEAAGRAA